MNIKNIIKQLKKEEGYSIWIKVMIVCLAILTFLLIKEFLSTKLISPVPEVSAIITEVKAVETPCNFDSIHYIRCSGEKLGKSNNDIRQMIRIARYESNFNPKAKNRNSTAKGVFQILDGTWKANKCAGDVYKLEDNIDCAWKIQSKRGFQPWVVYNSGKAK